MSTSAKKKTTKGIRYTDAQKKEVVDFATSYNTANRRGGQSQAAEKFGISPLTVAAWLVASGAPKASKATKAPKSSKATKAKSASKVGSRYTAEQKQEVLDYVASYNEANGRGGQSNAAAKFAISPLTVMAWLKASGAPKPGKKAKAAKATKKVNITKAAAAPKAATSGGFSAKLDALVGLNKQIEKTESELASLKVKFASLKASL